MFCLSWIWLLDKGIYACSQSRPLEACVFLLLLLEPWRAALGTDLRSPTRRQRHTVWSLSHRWSVVQWSHSADLLHRYVCPTETERPARQTWLNKPQPSPTESWTNSDCCQIINLWSCLLHSKAHQYTMCLWPWGLDQYFWGWAWLAYKWAMLIWKRAGSHVIREGRKKKETLAPIPVKPFDTELCNLLNMWGLGSSLISIYCDTLVL